MHATYRQIIILLAICSSCLTACFRPVYSKFDNKVTYDILANTEIIYPVGSINEAYFADNIMKIWPKSASVDPKYLLYVHISFKDSYNIIQRNSDILRQNIQAIVKYKFARKESGAVIISDEFTMFTSSNTSSFPYSSLMMIQDAYKNLSINAADRLLHKMTLYIHKHHHEIALK